MTVSECLKDWLSNYDNLDISEIATDFIDSGADVYSISKSPNTVVTPYVDGSKLITEYYQFFARKSTQDDDDRIDNQEVLAELEEWVEEQNENEELPDLSEVGSLYCQEVEVSSTATITSQEDDNAIYQLTIAIKYLKER